MGQKDQAEAHKVSFLELVFLLTNQALIQMGDLPNPLKDKIEVDLRGAQHSVDTLTMLLEKTKGNLDKNEDGILRNAVHDLRMRYVEAVQRETLKDRGEEKDLKPKESEGSKAERKAG